MKFPETNEEEDRIAYAEGFLIFGELRKKYSNDNVHDLDIVLNALCCSLCRVAYVNVGEEDYPHFIDLVRQILERNLINKTKKD